MISLRRLLPLLFFSLPLLARPTIATITPAESPVAGNVTVTISGDGFTTPMTVRIGGLPALEVAVVDEHTMTVRTPAHLPGSVMVEIQSDSGVDRYGGFQYTGAAGDAFERFLVPILLPPVHGGYGSEFRTEFEAHNAGFDPVNLFGLDYICYFECPPHDLLNEPIPLRSGEAYSDLQPLYNGTPGRFVYIAKAEAKNVGTKLRVYDTSREASNYGTEIRVPRAKDFVNERHLLFPVVPGDARFRLTLRIYGDPDLREALVLIDGLDLRSVPLRAGANLFDPAYAQLSDFPVRNGAMRVEVFVPYPPEGPPPPSTYPAVWAFFTVTNNDTQQITTITPN